MREASQDPRLVELALTVSDSSPVDWERALAESPDLVPALTQLRVLARVAEQHESGAAPPEPVPSEVLFRWGPLRVVKRLGAGGFGEVFAAWEPTLQRMVALKLRREDAGESGTLQWLLEARRLASVRHPNVLTVYGADVHDGRAGMWTELVAGRTLEEALAQQGVFGAREAAVIGMDVCAALSAVHASGLVHGDVKATNVMRVGASTTDVHASGRIVLMDFGAAREKDDGSAMGTPLGAAPELLRGEPASVASDLYALGVLLFRLVSGRYPFEATSLAELRERVSRGERTPLRSVRPDLPRAFVENVERALDADPNRRFGNAAEMERALGEAVRPLSTAPRWRARAVAIGAIGLALVATIAVVSLRDRPNPPPSTVRDESPVARLPDGHDPNAPLTTGSLPSAGSSPAPTATPKAPATLAPSEIEATLFLVNGAVSEPLRSGDRVGPGDRLGLEISSQEAFHAYVLDEDERGNVVALFPLPGGGAANPLAPGIRHRLPGVEGNEELYWQVTTAAGRERILVLASRERLPAIEQALAAAHPPREGAAIEYPRVGEAALLELRGIAGVARQPVLKPAGGSRLEELARRLATARAPVWVRLFVLENPAR